MSNAPKPIKAAKRVVPDFWNKKSHDGKTGSRVPVPHGEPPICCENSKQPTPQPVAKPWEHPAGARQCDPKAGGCGSLWTPEKK